MKSKDRELILSIEEVKAIVEEMKNTFISRDNPLCYQVITDMMWFLKEQENVGESQVN